MREGGENHQDATDNHHKKREKDDREPDEAQGAGQDKKTGDDGEDTQGVPPDWPAEQCRTPRKHDLACKLMAYTNERDNGGPTRSHRLVQCFLL